jgi:putative transposase
VAYRSTNKSVYSAKSRIVWCPKCRRRVLVGQVETRLAKFIAEVCAEHSV